MSGLPSFGPWQAVERLGEGGNCTVWRCRGADGAEIAVKALNALAAEDVERFVAEAGLLGQIDHPNVIRVHDIDAKAEPPWLAMDLMSGRDLDEERQEGPLEPEVAARLIADVAGGLAAVHEMGVRHRDLKPANIMRGTDGVPRLIDFGIARHIQETHKTKKGFVVGTAAYLAPEVFFGEDPQTAQDTETADVYALGQTLCEILTGQPVYEREGDTTLMVRIMKDKLERPCLDPRTWRPSVPAGLASVVMAVTRLEPEDRLQTAEALQHRLEAWLEERRSVELAPLSSGLPLPPPPATPLPLPPSNGAGLAAGSGLVVVGLCVLIALGGTTALWLLRPSFDASSLQSAVVAAGPTLAGCGTLSDRVQVVIEPSGAVTGTDPGRTEPATQQCLVRGLEALDLHPKAQVTVPLVLKGTARP